LKPFARGVMHAGFALTGVLTTLLGPILPALSARWRLDDAQAGFLFTAQFLGSLSGALLAGRVALRFGVRSAIIAGFAIAAAGVTAASAGPYSSGLGGVAIWGLGLGLIIPSVNLLVAELSPSRRAAALNVLNFAWGIGAVAAPPAIAATLRSADLRPLLVVLAVLLAAAALAVWLTCVDVAVGKATPAPGGVWRSSWIWMTGAFLFLYVGVENGLAGWMPSYSMRVLHLPYGAMAAAQGGFWGAILGVRLLAPALLRRMPAAFLIVSGLALASLGMLLLLASAGARILVTGALLAGAGLAAVFPTAVALFTERAGAQGARVTGVVFAMAAMGGAVLPWAVGAISTRFDSLRLALAAPLACSILMILLQLREMRSALRDS
jgi:FHS family glucose/mannose:H+ symporter-like MFS transporter